MPHNEILCREDGEQIQFERGESVKFNNAVAYSGGAITQFWSLYPVVIDLAGLAVAPQVPLLYDHDNEVEGRIGVTNPFNDGMKIRCSGIIQQSKIGRMITESGREIPWQLSVRTTIEECYTIKEGEKATINGRDFTGPLFVASKTTLREISVVAIGADPDTILEIAACLRLNQTKENNMSAKNPKNAAAPAAEPAQIIASDSGAGTPAVTAEPPTDVTAAATPPPQEPENSVAAQVEAALAARDHQIAENRKQIEALFGNDFPEEKQRLLSINASYDDAKTAYIEAMRHDREAAAGFNIHVKKYTQADAAEMFTAAALLAGGKSRDEIMKKCGEKAVEAAESTYKNSLGLKDLVLTVARHNGYTGTSISAGNFETVASFAGLGMGSGIAAAGVGFTPISLPGIFSNTANKSLLMGYNAPEQSWRRVARISAARDFKEHYYYRLDMNANFQKVPKGGEIPNSQLYEEAYTNKAETYGAMIVIDRTDIINDDLGALVDLPFRYGINAARALNTVFWTEFADNSTFFTSAAGNQITNPLSVEGLAAATSAFAHLKDAAGNIIGVRPKILLVPAALMVTASQLYRDTNIIPVGITNTKAAVMPSGNPFQSRYEPVDTAYLDDPSIPNSSSTAWYLLADPMEVATIDVIFLDGIQYPRVENLPAGINILGWACRAVMDFGVAKMDPLGGVMSTGAGA